MVERKTKDPSNLLLGDLWIDKFIESQVNLGIFVLAYNYLKSLLSWKYKDIFFSSVL